jgi:hypothetical protein
MSEDKYGVEFRTSACGEQEAALEDYLNGELAETETGKLTEHLQSCTGCANALAVVSLAWKLSATAALALVALVTFDTRQHQNRVSQDEFAVVAAHEAPELLSDEARLPSNRDETLILMAEGSNAKH